MSDEDMRDLSKTFRTSQEKYMYFQLAVTGAAIAFALDQTNQSSLKPTHMLLGFAVLSWGISFFFGCIFLKYNMSTLYANVDFLKIKSGHHPDVGSDPQMIAAASEGVRQAIETNSDRAGKYWQWQFRLMIFGAIIYISWHVLEMYMRSC